MTDDRYAYLPRKAAQRKLILRRNLGLAWVFAALGAAAAVAVTGVVFFASRPDRPGAPYAEVGPLLRYEEGGVTAFPDGTGWLDRRAGLLAVAGPSEYCPADGGWVAPDGTRTSQVTTWPVRVAGGRVYIDRTHPATHPVDKPDTPCRNPQRAGEPAPADGL